MNKILKNIFIIIALAFISPILVSASISCKPNYAEDITGKSVTFTVSNTEAGDFTYTWGGGDGLTGIGESVSKTYFTSGTKNVEVSADDGVGGHEENTCEVIIYLPSEVSAPKIYSCGPSVATAYINQEDPQTVSWSANISGGLAPYTLTWTGDNDFVGQDNYEYTATGTMSANLAVMSRYGDQTAVTGSTLCEQTVKILGEEIETEDLTNVGTSCSASDTSIYTNDSSTWNAVLNVTGGAAPYFISWYGADDLSGNGDSITKSYSSTGIKNAKIISIGSSDGSSIDVDIDCLNTVTVRNHRSGGGSSSSLDEETATSTDSVATSTATSTPSSTPSIATSTPTLNSTSTPETTGAGDEVDNNVDEDTNGYKITPNYLFIKDQNPGTYSEEVANLQNRLTEEGFYNGLIGGFFGPATEQALKDYQKQNGLIVTGVLDAKTRVKLNGLIEEEVLVKATGTSSGLVGLLSAAVGTAGDFGSKNWGVILYSLLVVLAFGLIFWFFMVIKKSDQNK